MTNALTARIERGDVVLIDGATGTELERHGVPMVEGAWTGDAARTHAEALQAVHASHIHAGADLIIANTFASSRHLLAYGGLEEHFEGLNRRGVEIALAARDAAGRPEVAVAGSMSTSHQGGPTPPLEVVRRNFREQAAILADAGSELIALEMMRDIDQTLVCIEAVVETGLPLWLGFSCHAEGRPEPILWEETATLSEGLAAIADAPVEVLSIMHTEVTDVDACLDVIEAEWDGPVGVYAHSGDFVHPHWVFNGVISAEDHTAHALRWVDRGVQVIGGCCGITCDHIAHLNTALAAR